MKRVITIITCIILFFPAGLQSQQLPHFTQFMFNDYVLNPAVAGTKDYYQVRANSRFQWAGIVDAPQTVSLSLNGPHSTRPMGFGGYLYNDVTGPTSRTGLYGTYAYNIAIKGEVRLSMGLSFGIMQNKIDGTEITLHDPNDLAMQGGITSSIVPDASVGFYFYANNWYAGFSAFQLFSNNLKVYDEKNGLNKLKSHFYLLGGYRFDINDQFTIEPSLIIKGMSPVPIQIDLNAKVTYQEMVWLGFSYRSRDAVSILLGYIQDKRYYFGYSYDFSTSDIRSYNSGSHEIMIGIRFTSFRR
jgi:type IX secretion system PorP/SprF family membrane protein